MSARRHRSRRTGRHFVATLVVLCLLPIVLAAAQSVRSYARTLEAAQTDARRAAQSMSAWIEQSFDTVVRLSRSVDSWLGSEGVVDAESFRHRALAADVPALLAARSDALPRVSDLFLVDADGRRLSAPTPDAPDSGTAAKPPVFDLHAQPLGDRRLTMAIVEDEPIGVWTIHRMVGRNGEIIGGIVATIDPRWFERVLENAGSFYPARVSLDHVAADGTATTIAAIGPTPTGRQPIQLRETAAIDAVSIRITAEPSRPVVLAGWYREARTLAGVVGLWELVLALGAILFRRQQVQSTRDRIALRRVELAAERAARSALLERMRADERAIAAIFDNGAIGFVEIGLPEYRFLRVNDRYCRFVGRSAEELLGGLGPFDVCHPDEHAPLRSAMASIHEDGTFDTEIRHLRPDGRSVWARIAVKITANHPDGSPSRSVVVVQDVTELRQAMQRAQDNEAMLRLGMSIGHIATFSRDSRDDGFVGGREGREMLGLPLDDETAPFDLFGVPMPPEDRDRIAAEIAAATARHEQEHSYAFRIIRPTDGRICHIEARARYEYDTQGHHRSTGVLIDLTESRHAEELLRLSLSVGRIGTFHHDFVTGRVHFDATTGSLYGLPASERSISAEDWFAMIVPEDREALIRGLEEAEASHRGETCRDYRVRRRDDDGIRHFTVRSRIDYGPEGRLRLITGVIIDVTEQRAAEACITHLAHHDALTGLPNRGAFHDRLIEAVTSAEHGSRSALLLIDLDRFKEVNDTLGHPAGDDLLRAVTTRLCAELGSGDLPARLGGDEFAVIRTARVDLGEVTDLAGRLVSVLGEPFRLGDHQVLVGASIGIALSPGDGRDPEVLFRAADLALYRAKAEGRGRYRFFEPGMDAELRRRRSREIDLRHAVDAHEFDLVYQPIVATIDRRIVGFEARLQWHHPEKGILGPAAFVTLAEETGLMVGLGARMLTLACAEATDWPGERRLVYGLSTAEITSRSIVETVERALRLSGLPPRRLELEIGERALVRSPETVLEAMSELKRLGVILTLDDFGSVSSALGLVPRCPIDRIKIDRQLSIAPDTTGNVAIVRTITGLCDDLGLGIAVDGIADEERLTQFGHTRFGEAQGELFGDALDGRGVLRRLREVDRGARSPRPEQVA
jgi:diguanylate cyclase (GGDEF)-like protein/PAS domain S-box-containing protein